MWKNKSFCSTSAPILSHVFVRLKTGDLPPPDIEFEEMLLRREKKSISLTRRLSRSNFNKKSGKHNLFQEKRIILKNIENHKSEIYKGNNRLSP